MCASMKLNGYRYNILSIGDHVRISIWTRMTLNGNWYNIINIELGYARMCMCTSVTLDGNNLCIICVTSWLIDNKITII